MDLAHQVVHVLFKLLSICFDLAKVFSDLLSSLRVEPLSQLLLHHQLLLVWLQILLERIAALDGAE